MDPEKNNFVLILLRHGLAGDPDAFQRRFLLPDAERPLTKRGRQELKLVIKVLGQLVGDVDLILTSPFVRAYETARFLNKKFTRSRFLVCPDIRPMIATARTHKFLQSKRLSGVVAMVGHEPQLSRFLSFILTGEVSSNFHIKKGGFAIIESDQKLTPRLARLKCLVQPSHIKKILN